MLLDSKNLPFCVRFRTEKILSSKIRYFDVIILIPNLIFLFFIIIKWIRKRTKLNTNKPLLLSITCLLLSVILTNILRCLFVMIFSNQSFHAQEIIVKIFWLLIRFALLWTELSILLFGVCFGHSSSNRQSIKIIKILITSFIFSSIYTTSQAVLEFRRDTRPIQFQTTYYNLYSHGGMKFLFISSSIFLILYLIIFTLWCLCRRQQKCLPIRRSFYFYCFVLIFVNMIQVIGAMLNLTETTIWSMCIVEGMTCIFYTCFAPFVYYQFLRRVLSSKLLIPEILYADSTLTNNDEDDELIDTGANPFYNNSTDEKLDGQFEDITSSTNIIQPVL
ncbi:unnamed protein product [Adineta steineri]|uniref:Uncharacterized protein n=2 Tax=Adineta steineri TaxID=433720 RepID=A0A818FY00_9BILA|nr:unnamed protein product [Adineta steineri]